MSGSDSSSAPTRASVAAAVEAPPPAAGILPLYDTADHSSRSLAELARLFAASDLVIELIRRNVRLMYKRSLFGVLWSILHPLFLMACLTVVFSTIFRTDVPHFTLHVFAGLLIWTFFSQATQWAMNDLVFGGTLLRRVRIPATAFACAAVGTGLVNLMTSLPVLVVIAFLEGAPIGAPWLMIPVAILCATAFTLGIALALSAGAAYFTDVTEMYRVVLLAWMYLTPIFYPVEVLPAHVQAWLWLNPFLSILEVFRTPFQSGEWPSLAATLYASGISMFVLVAGWIVFARKTDDLIYRV